MKLFNSLLLSSITTLSFAAELPSVKLGGDVRFRIEGIEDASKNTPEDSYLRPRVRARLKASSQVNEWTKATIRLCSEGSAVSCNQTLGGVGSSKGFFLDLAYVEFDLPVGFDAKLGKMKFPHYKAAKSELIWDGDFNPEGIYLGYTLEAGDFKINANAGEYELVSIKELGEDKVLVAGQITASMKAGKNKFNIGSAYYGYHKSNYDNGLQKEEVIFSKTKGNSSSDSQYLYNYNIMNAYFDATFNVNDIPLGVFGDYAQNTAIEKDNKGYSFGASLGQAKKPGTIALKALYKHLEKDAVLDGLTDSDFIGGGTDGKGVETVLKSCVGKNVFLNLTYFLNTKSLDDETRYQRVQADVQVKF